MSTPSKEDTLFAEPRNRIVDFVFDESVAQVFPDMIYRSVPGYQSIIAMLGLFAEQYLQANSRCYDLGCSLGAATLSMASRIREGKCRIIAVDNSPAMVERCRVNISESNCLADVEVICADVQDVCIQDASVVVLNFTLQFIEQEQRLALLKKIYSGLLDGGVLVLSEKIIFADPAERKYQESMHAAFKRANGYSDLEISQKRTALERVLVCDTLEQHKDRLGRAGFREVRNWFQCFNFASLLAIK